MYIKSHLQQSKKSMAFRLMKLLLETLKIIKYSFGLSSSTCKNKRKRVNFILLNKFEPIHQVTMQLYCTSLYAGILFLFWKIPAIIMQYALNKEQPFLLIYFVFLYKDAFQPGKHSNNKNMNKIQVISRCTGTMWNRKMNIYN